MQVADEATLHSDNQQPKYRETLCRWRTEALVLLTRTESCPTLALHKQPLPAHHLRSWARTKHLSLLRPSPFPAVDRAASSRGGGPDHARLQLDLSGPAREQNLGQPAGKCHLDAWAEIAQFGAKQRHRNVGNAAGA